jgi:hypothetical protein
MLSFSEEREPVVISLSDMARHTEVDWSGNGAREVWGKLMESIIGCCVKYHNNSSLFLPNLTAEDAYFDQRKLKVVFTYDKVILDALGLLHPDIKSTEAKLTFAPTPMTSEEDCWLEADSDSQLEMSKKYYLKRQEEEENSQDVQERIFVWRLIDLIFYLRNGEHLTQHYYQLQYPNSAFCFKRFKETRKRVYEDI